MTPDFVQHLAGDAIRTFLLAAGPVLAVSLVVGLAVSFVQAVTQIQDFTLTFVPKILAVFLCLFLLLPWMADLLGAFASRVIGGIPACVR